MPEGQDLDSYLRSLGGRPGTGQNVFTIDPLKAREKLGLLGRQVPEYYFLKLVQFGTSQGATSGHLDFSSTHVETRFTQMTPVSSARVVELFHNPGLVKTRAEGYLIQCLYAAGSQHSWTLEPGDGTRLRWSTTEGLSLCTQGSVEFKFVLEREERPGLFSLRRDSRAAGPERLALRTRVTTPFRFFLSGEEKKPMLSTPSLMVSAIYGQVVLGDGFLMRFPEYAPRLGWHDPPRFYRTEPHPWPAGTPQVSQFWSLLAEPAPDLLIVVRDGVMLDPIDCHLGEHCMQVIGDFPQLRLDATGLALHQDDALEQLLQSLQLRTLEIVERLLLETDGYEELSVEAYERWEKALVASPLVGLSVPMVLGLMKAGLWLSAMSYPLATVWLLGYALRRKIDPDKFSAAGDGRGRELLVSRLQAMRSDLKTRTGRV